MGRAGPEPQRKVPYRKFHLYVRRGGVTGFLVYVFITKREPLCHHAQSFILWSENSPRRLGADAVLRHVPGFPDSKVVADQRLRYSGSAAPTARATRTPRIDDAATNLILHSKGHRITHGANGM